MTAIPKNKLQENLKKIKTEIGQPSHENERISYGVIAEVDASTSQVKVRYLQEDLIPGDLVSKCFLPEMNSLDEIHTKYGALRPGLLARIHWRGQVKAKTAIAEVIGEDNLSFLKKDLVYNEIETGPYFLFTGASIPIVIV